MQGESCPLAQKSMKTSLFDYQLPKKLIAQKPKAPRDHSRLMIIDRKRREILHRHFYDIPKFLTKNDCLVFNQTKVYPARIYAKKETGGKIEVLFLEEVENGVWEALTSPGLKENQKVVIKETKLKCVGHRGSSVLIKTDLTKDSLLKLLKKVGHTPLPPYIKSTDNEISLREKYQTIYAKKIGSVAAPTAGFHFTKKLIKNLKTKGVQMEYLTLHVGLGTFVPVKTCDIEKHKMHKEYFEIDSGTIKKLNKAKNKGKRIITVGTTTTRVLETLAKSEGFLSTNYSLPTTNLFIHPPYKFKFVDALITNFHLPKSTLLLMISAFVSFPNTKQQFTKLNNCLIGKAYNEAIAEKYRFYSFGDASFFV